ncbi:helix-turn-helix domain-containing protein [Cetobacterium somerae]|uniref:helix-turn-helix domain-containing protein n=1 Tax=Cetobacterium somerae TaxID=188913 RepID=UPI003D7684AD
MELKVVLKKLRESRNLTIKQLAEKSGLGNGTVGDIERGSNGARITTLKKIAEALELTKQEKEELFSCLIPDEVARLNKREKKQYDDFLNEATLYFKDEKISEEDKKKVLDTLTELFFEAKQLRKIKK